MMSHQPSSLQSRQGLLHRRQNSTPVAAFEAMKVQNPTTTPRPNSQHRRGQSQDSRSPIRRQPHQRTGSMVSITNIGSTPQGQQILREAQQQRIARPGQHQHSEVPISPQCGIFQSIPDSSFAEGPYDTMTMNAGMQHPQTMPHHSQYIVQGLELPMSAGLPMEFNLDENNHHYFQNSHPVNQYMGGMPVHDRRMSQPELRVHTGMRPLTPSQQVQTARFPLTPATTPFRIQSVQYARSAQPSPTHQFQNDTICSPYPVSMQKSRSLQGIVEQDESRFQPRELEVAELPVPTSFQNQSSQHEDQSLSQDIPDTDEVPTAKGTPKQQLISLFDQPSGETVQIDGKTVPVLGSKTEPECSSPSRPALSPRRMSISDLNLEPGISASIEETNVTLDDIAQFIEGPDSNDNKWVCKYEDCNKRFGRKENIKSHVQTHLGDRQFRCDHCKKCFVRGHDLKRHAKIHTGTKPYPCLCGNAFARHDALTRHRQRGMCIGAFDGIVKKVIKRGRPRKHRPEMDERVDKASRSRHNQTNSEYGQDQYTSSASSCSLSSWGSPPTETMDQLSIRGQSPYEDFGLFSLPQHSSQNMVGNMTLPSDIFAFTPPASPGYSTGNKPSPSYRELTPTEIAEITGDMPLPAVTRPGQQSSSADDLHVMNNTSASMLTADSIIIQRSQQSLPSLSHSSSSPAADVVAFDFGPDDQTMSSMHNMSMGMGMGMKLDERNDFDSFLDYGGMEMGADNNGADLFFAL